MLAVSYFTASESAIRPGFVHNSSRNPHYNGSWETRYYMWKTRCVKMTVVYPNQAIYPQVVKSTTIKAE